MSALTIRLPDDTTQRLKTLAQSQGLSVNKLVEEMSAQAIAVFDVEMRFKTLAAGADREKALVILDRLPWSVMWRKPTMYLPKRRSLPWGKSGKTTSSGEIETEHPAYLGSQDTFYVGTMGHLSTDLWVPDIEAGQRDRRLQGGPLWRRVPSSCCNERHALTF